MRRVKIVGEVKLRITHHLLACHGSSLSKIIGVYSHPQALMQCAGYLKKHKKMVPNSFFDTAGSALWVSQQDDPTIASIASAQAAKNYGLKILASSIEDNCENYTRFLVIAKDSLKQHFNEKSQRPYKTSIVLSLKSIPGALHRALSIFAIRDIDLLKIESRPIHGKPWNYRFYIDFSGHHLSTHCKNAINHLEEICAEVKVLGSYLPASN